ncbi:MAG: Ig-like domain-containing protein [Eubacterium sp.]|nr:Ig-like domain-containing protein [Eubacterium sp.]
MDNMKKWSKLVLIAFAFMAMAVISGNSKAEAVSTYKIKVNKQCCVVNVYKHNGKKYKAIKAFICSPGYATPTGTFHLGEKMKWHTLDGPSYGQYCCRITGSILFHSVWYYEVKKNTQSYVQYNKLGTKASHGCVRLTVGDAKWIYDNIPSGTPIVIYNSKKPGPLGKPAAIKVKGTKGWDPTDPDSSNPYKKKKPKIKGVKNKTLKYGASFKVKKGITATNTTGFNATSRIKIKIYYRASSADEYKKVKKVDTKKPGTYKVVYSVKDEIAHKASKTAIITVEPGKYVKKITLNKTEKTLYVGGDSSWGTFKLKATSITPEDAPVKKLEFSSAGTKIATVTTKGVVQAIKAGNVYITARALDGSDVFARCLITVKQLVTSIKVKVPSDRLEIGKSMQLKATPKPSNADNKELSYISSDKSIATISSSGSITGVAPGEVTITVKSKDKNKTVKTVKITIYDPAAEPVAEETNEEDKTEE